jgi:hypothetical protein
MISSERPYDNERRQLCAELVFQSAACYPAAESAVLAELAWPGTTTDEPEKTAVPPRFGRAGIFRLPFFGRPSLT